MNKSVALPLLMAFSFLFGDNNVQIRLENGQKAQGEFVGTYMNHVHILVEEKIIYYACNDIVSITYADGGLSYGKSYAYDCSKNTVTADILFPPELDPMTGEWAQMLPDVFNLNIPKLAVEKATSVIQNPAAQVETGGVSATEDFVIIDGVKYARVSPEKGVSELIKDQNYPDSLVSPSHPKVNSDLKNISISLLTKEQKKKYNQNRIRIRKKNFDWYASYIKKGFFTITIERLNKSEFFRITGYPDKAEIAEHNTQLKRKNQLLGTLIFYLGLGIARGTENPIGMVISYGGAGYFFYDYNVKKLDGASIKDAKIIAEKYNNDLMQRIINENE